MVRSNSFSDSLKGLPISHIRSLTTSARCSFMRRAKLLHATNPLCNRHRRPRAPPLIVGADRRRQGVESLLLAQQRKPPDLLPYRTLRGGCADRRKHLLHRPFPSKELPVGQVFVLLHQAWKTELHRYLVLLGENSVDLGTVIHTVTSVLAAAEDTPRSLSTFRKFPLIETVYRTGSGFHSVHRRAIPLPYRLDGGKRSAFTCS